MTRHELRTPRLSLRAWRDSDRAPFAQMCGDARVMQWFPSTMDRRSTDAFVDRLDAAHDELGYTSWAVEVIESERGPCPFVGYVGLLQPSFDAPFAHRDPLVEVGWRLAADWWGLGIATEGAVAALAFGFDVVGLPEVVSFTVPANIRSQAVMQRIGMRYDGVFEHPRGVGEWWGPHVLYRATAVDLERSAAQEPGAWTDPSGRTPP